ncbi:hypothetical protein [Noviherbaspirillum cavernae]|nr:hypothetical protein [Noviherbaspirillum cavernae]
MDQDTIALQQWIQAQTGIKRNAPGLAGIAGRLLLQVNGMQVAVMQIDDGFLELTNDSSDADAVSNFLDVVSIVDFLTGTLNPAVAMLQGKMDANGDLYFTVKTLFGLQVGQPFDPVEFMRENGDA